tara:strand:+ start:65 stop:301 length:237 start_codon:yes stop_codon:yes gene_type:complete
METYLGLYIIFSCAFMALRSLYLAWVDIPVVYILTAAFYWFVIVMSWLLGFAFIVILAPIFSFPVYVYDKVKGFIDGY